MATKNWGNVVNLYSCWSLSRIRYGAGMTAPVVAIGSLSDLLLRFSHVNRRGILFHLFCFSERTKIMVILKFLFNFEKCLIW